MNCRPLPCQGSALPLSYAPGSCHGRHPLRMHLRGCQARVVVAIEIGVEIGIRAKRKALRPLERRADRVWRAAARARPSLVSARVSSQPAFPRGPAFRRRPGSACSSASPAPLNELSPRCPPSRVRSAESRGFAQRLAAERRQGQRRSQIPHVRRWAHAVLKRVLSLRRAAKRGYRPAPRRYREFRGFCLSGSARAVVVGDRTASTGGAGGTR